MQISVIAVLPSSAPSGDMVASMAGTSGQGLQAPEGLTLDPAFTAVPITGFDAGMLTDSLGGAPVVAVRGTIEVDPEQGPPRTIGNATIFADPTIEPFLTCGNDPAVGSAQDVQTNLDTATLSSKGLDGSNVAIAIMDTGIDLNFLTNALGWSPNFDASLSWTPPGQTTAPGQWPTAHATMCAFDSLIAASSATLLDYPILQAPSGGGSVISGVLSTALQAYGTLFALWTSGSFPYSALVLSNSWGVYDPSWDFPAGHPGRYIDNPNHPFNLLVTTIGNVGVDVLFAAGNCGADCPAGRCATTTGSIMGANAMQSVLTLAGCDNNGARVGYSSQGPSIANMFQDKPDVTSYTHFTGSGVFAPAPDNGTSAACPVAAGCVAAIRTKLSPTSGATPAQLCDQIRATATVPGRNACQWDGDYGWGIFSPVAVANAFNL